MNTRTILTGLVSLGVIVGGIAVFESCSINRQTISFTDQVKPILNQKCMRCHGGVRQLGDFSLLFREEALATTESGGIGIIPGNHKKSELYKRIVHTDPELRMPLEGDPLSEEEIKILTQWIDEGAQWEEHWSYTPLEAPGVEASIDKFIQKGLKDAGLSPNGPAQPAILARRAALDLTGLPPEASVVEQYLESPSLEKYEAYVDQLLASPHFGERWAAMWLDLARYADSKGYEKDAPRSIWKYRDWVIHAFNNDLPFDEFTIQQLAGDQLMNPSKEQLIATGFQRNSMTNTEGGTDDEEFRVAAVIDRVNTAMEVWQGTTIGCVQCHSHPYDPYLQEDYYKLYAYFNNSQDADQDNEFPQLELYQPADAANIDAIIKYIQELSPTTNVNKDDLLAIQIKQALFPRLIPQHVDDFQNVVMNWDGGMSNLSNNMKSAVGRRYFFQYNAIPLDRLKGIEVTYSAGGNESQIIIRKDQIDGEILGQVDVPSTSKIVNGKPSWYSSFKQLTIPINSEGKHNLIFELVNTTGNNPEGIVRIKELLLDYGQPLIQAWKASTDKLIQFRGRATMTSIMKPKPGALKRNTHVFERGNALMPGQEVQPGLPEWMPQPDPSIEEDRLQFAKWLVDPENPLTARVAVNRFWEQIFGTGIVETLEDFGSQGAKPTHPELLDYLAYSFIHEHDWSVKELLKSIVLSDTYQQSSMTNAEKQELDPYNQYLSRGPRFRLSAEQIRDQALAVSGLLNDSIGGKSVMPPQPDGIWQVVYSALEWKTNEQDRYRRGLYTYWKRTTPYPSMISFDSPSREFCVSRRIRTNTPLQALVTMNDPVYVEAAQELGDQMLQVGNGDLERSIEYGYYKALLKQPNTTTIEVLKELYEDARIALNTPQVISTSQKEERPGESFTQPMHVVANAILNLDAFFTKE